LGCKTEGSEEAVTRVLLMTPSRKEVLAALREHLVPRLRQRGFRGSLPHLRRTRATQIDLLTVQFNRTGGSFIIEIAKCDPTGTTMHWGEHIPPHKVTAHDLHPKRRHRLGSPAPGEDGRWFHFDNGESLQSVAKSTLGHLEEAEIWWNWTDSEIATKPSEA
jgi:Domain of unknown function (DUF4304)